MPPKRKSLQPEDADAGYLRLEEVLRLFPVGRRSWYRGIELGKYPRPIKLSERTSAWRRTDIYKLLEAVDTQP